MKIRKSTKEKRIPPPPAEVTAFISTILASPDEDLSTLLATCSTWVWPRGDLHSWTKVLDRFDELLEKTIEEYSLEGLQVNEFTPLTKATLLEILRFERLLLEHCTNRKLYASYDRLGSLLFTQDNDVLEATIRLLHRPAQQYSSPSHSSELSTNTLIIKRLLTLSHGWGPTREAGLELSALASKDDSELDFPLEIGEVSFQFYRRPGMEAPDNVGSAMTSPTILGSSSFSAAATPTATPTPSSSTTAVVSGAGASEGTFQTPSRPLRPKGFTELSRESSFKTPVPPSATPTAGHHASTTTEGLTTLVLGNLCSPMAMVMNKKPMDVLADVVEEHAVPQEERFELLNKIRIAMGVTKKETRQQLIRIRCLAVATYAYLVNEATAQTELFLYEPDLISTISSLLRMDLGDDSVVPYGIQTTSIMALDALSRYRHHLSEVISAVNAGANHGLLMSLFRNCVGKLSTYGDDPPFDFVETLFAFLTYLISTPTYSNMLISAGIVPLLVQVVKIDLPSRLQAIVKATFLLDHVVYSNPNGFSIFCNANGVDILVDRIKIMVDTVITETSAPMETEQINDNPYGRLPFPRFSALKAFIRSLHRMMQTAGTAEGLRNLIDSSFPKSIKRIIENRNIFGATLLSHSINAMATFVHNEPTSLAVLQELKLPQAFYDAIEEDLEPSAELLVAVTSAIGALCLNQPGLDLLNERTAVLPKIVDVCTSERHLKTLEEKDTAASLGAYVDELVRHHPTLRDPVIKAILVALNRIKTAGSVVPDEDDGLYTLLPASPTETAPEPSEDAVMEPAPPPELPVATTEKMEAVAKQINSEPEAAAKSSARGHVDNKVVMFMGVTARFLEGFFHNQSHCKEFIKLDGLKILLEFYTLPCVPYDFAGSAAAESLYALFRAMSDVNPGVVFSALLQPVRVALDATASLWKNPQADSVLAKFTNLPAGDEHSDANKVFRQLVCLHGRISLLSDMYRSVGFGHAKIATSFLQILSQPKEAETLRDLGRLGRTCIWENILLKTTVPSDTIVTAASDTSASATGPVTTDINAVTTSSASSSVITSTTLAVNTSTSHWAKVKNVKSLMFLAGQVPKSLTPFYQAILKLFVFKRHTDANHRKLATQSAYIIAEILKEQLDWGLDVDNKLDKVTSYAYISVTISMANLFLYDERSFGQGTVQTMLLSAFEYINGVVSIVKVTKKLLAPFEELTEESEQDHLPAHHGLKLAFNLINSLVSAKHLFDSPQTTYLTTKDNTLSDKDDFEPHRFLVILRLTVLPLIKDIWNSSWLQYAPEPIIRVVTQILLRIMDSDHEERPAASTTGILNPAVRPPPPADRIQQLVDMGFSRIAAQRALTRSHNNTSIATELLLSNPDFFAEVPEVAAESEVVPAAGPVSVPMEADAPLSNTGEDSVMEGTSLSTSKNAESPVSPPNRWLERRPELEILRDDIRPTLATKAIALTDSHEDLVFVVKAAFMGPKPAAGGVAFLLERLEAAIEGAYDTQQKQMTIRLRLLGVVLKDATVAELTEGSKEWFETAVGLMVTLINNGTSAKLPHPKWLSAQLLVLEGLLVLGEEPKDVSVLSTSTTPEIALQDPNPTLVAAKQTIFKYCMQLLPQSEELHNEFHIILKLIAVLTRDNEMGIQFANGNGLTLAMAPFKKATTETSKLLASAHGFIIMILRHIVENPVVLQSAMRQEIKQWFAQPRSRGVDVAHFVKNNKQVALRDPAAFIKAVSEECSLISPEPQGGLYTITVLPTKHSNLQQSVTDNEAHALPTVDLSVSTPDMQVDEPALEPLATSVSDVMETLIHHLLSELLVVGKRAIASVSKPVSVTKAPVSEVLPAPTTTSAIIDTKSLTPGITSDESKTSAAADQDPNGLADYVYSCLLMQNLTELTGSYMGCKNSFLTMGRKKPAVDAPNSTPSTKPRTAVLNYILQDIICCTGLTEQVPPHSPANRKRLSLTNWGMSVIVALCSDVNSTVDLKDVSSDLVAVRKVVLDGIAKSIKDTLSSAEHIDIRYGRLHTLSELCYRLLTARASVTPKGHDDSTLLIAKIMLEKNFAVLLTNALAEIDLNYPDVKLVVTDILKPLEHLTKISIKMGRASDKKKDSAQNQVEMLEESSSSSMDEDEDEDDDEDEGDNAHDDGEDDGETPDLYRNSALGMFGGEMDEMYDEDSDDDEEDDMEEFDEMEGMSEAPTESGTDDSDSEGEEGVLEGDLVAEDEEWADTDGEDEDMVGQDPDDVEDEEEGDMMFPDEDGMIDGILEEDPDDMEEIEEGHILMDEDDEPDEDDELDQFEHELGLEPDFDMAPIPENRPTNWGWAPPAGSLSREDARLSGSRQRRMLDESDIAEMLGRPRSRRGEPPLPQGMILDQGGLAMRFPVIAPAGAGGQPGGAAAALLGLGEGPHLGGSNIMQTIEDLLGEPAVRMLQTIVTRAGANPNDTFSIGIGMGPNGPSIQASGVLPASRHHMHPSVDNLFNPASVEDAAFASVQEYSPLPTGQRWQIEERLVHGRFASDRVRKLTNHTIHYLLPAAKENDKKTKDRLATEMAAAEKARSEREAEAEKLRQLREAAAAQKREEELETQRRAEEEAAAAEEEAAALRLSQSAMEGTDVEMADAAVAGPSESASGELSGSEPEPPARVTIMIHGNAVDITDTGIDVTFLEALPDNMREEIVNQHIRERQPISDAAPPPPSELSAEFLDALPPDIRAEVLQQEAREAARRASAANSRRQREEGDEAAVALPADIDPASFLASLDPQLRQVVLMEQEDGFLQTLPGAMVAELNSFREQSHRRFQGRVARGPAHPLEGSHTGGQGGALKKPANRDAIQLLDKAGIASLVRLLFFPEVSRKQIVPRVLVNLCENSKTRAELLNLLLTVVQDGTGDLAAVDKSFAQMTLRGGKTSSTPRVTPKRKGFPDTPGPAGLFSHLSTESVPTFIAQRCFDALYQIVTAIDKAPLFFLTEHDMLVGLKRTTNKKGKGKEKAIPQTKYPVVVLLGLLDRPALLKNSGMMDALTNLLVIVTRPLTSLQSTKSESTGEIAKALLESAPTASAVPSTGSTNSPALPLSIAGNVDNASAGPSQPKVPSQEENALTLSHPPQIPNTILRLVVNILTVGDCSSMTFKYALTLINNLSFIPEAKEVITSELRGQAQELGSVLQAELEMLSSALVVSKSGDTGRTQSVSKFSPASSTQAKLLRILKALEHMYTSKSPPAAPEAVPAAAERSPQTGSPTSAKTGAAAVSTTSTNTSKPPEENPIQRVYESFRFVTLWHRLGDCLAAVEESPDLVDIATVLLPAIEALMVVSKYVGVKPQSVSAPISGPLSPRSPSGGLDVGVDDVFVRFTDTHRKVLNLIVRNNPALMSGSFALLVENPKVLEFDNKRNYFSQQLRRRPNRDHHPGTLQVNVRREFVFEDSFRQFQKYTPENVKYGKLSCRFYNEEGVDAGGVSREWFSVLARSIFNPNFALFEPSSTGALTYQINRHSAINGDHLAYFKFVGVVLAKAVQDGRLLDAHFIRSVYRQLLGAKNMGLQDLEIVDPSYHTSLKWMAENDIDDVLDLNFSVESDAFGAQQIYDLIPNGRNVPVTNDNKLDYIQRVVNYRLADSVKDQSKAFIDGFTTIIPQSLLKIFDAGELELLISGLPTIDVDELKNSVQLHGWRNSDAEIVWFWRTIRSFTQAERASFLQFTTGSARVPLGGFSQLVGSNGIQPLQIHRAHGDADRIPTSHTCFNQIDLGPYTSYEALRDKVLLAITEGATGFGFA